MTGARTSIRRRRSTRKFRSLKVSSHYFLSSEIGFVPDVDSNQNDKWNPGPNKDIPDLQIFFRTFQKDYFSGVLSGGKETGDL